MLHNRGARLPRRGRCAGTLIMDEPADAWALFMVFVVVALTFGIVWLKS